MKRDFVIYLIAGILFFIGLVCIMNNDNSSSSNSFSLNKNTKNRGNSHISNNDVEFLDNSKKSHNIPENAYELLGNVDPEQAFELGLGMGPGLYGSGRHFAEMTIL